MNARLKTGQTLSAARRHMATHLRNAHIETLPSVCWLCFATPLERERTALMCEEARVLD